MIYGGKKYKLIAGNEGCSGCVFEHMECSLQVESFKDQGGQNCNDDYNSYYIEDEVPVERQKRKKLKISNR